MIPTGRISIFAGKTREPVANNAEIILGPDIVTYRVTEDDRWATRPLSALNWIEWDDFPFQPEGGDEIAFLQQFITNLSPDDLEAAVNEQIGVDGMHRQGEWIKAALLGMIDG